MRLQGGKWRPVRTLPEGQKVMIRTVSGLERLAWRARGERVRPRDQWGPERVHCFGVSPHSDLQAIGWRTA